MASRIQGITVEIGGDTTKLSSALKSLNSEIKNTQSQLKDVEKLLKMDPGNTELLAQKEKLLAQSVDETKQKLESLKTAAEQANTALENGDIPQEQYDALQREILETEQDLKKLEAAANQSSTALQKIGATGEKLKTVGDGMQEAGKKMLPATAAVTALGTASVSAAANFESAMSQVQATMGITADSMSTVDGQSVNTIRDKNGMPEVAMHWEHRMGHAVARYNEIYKVQMPHITPHICRHTYCSNMARSGMNPKTLQYLMGHSDISVTMNTYTHLGLDDAKNEMIRLEELERAKKEVEKASGNNRITQRMIKAIQEY